MVKAKAISFNGKTQSLSAWAKELGVSKQTLHERLRRHKLSDALRDAAGRATVRARRESRWVVIDDTHLTVTQAAKHFEVTLKTIYRWIKDKHIVTYRENEHPCSGCGKTGHRINTCPDLFLKRGGRRVPFAPPTAKELARAVGQEPEELL